LAVLLRYGVAAWIHARAELPTVPTPPAPAPPTGSDQMVAVLAAMALAVVRGG
jgi:hypothetical protein